jgi:hypothetical protein
MRPHRGLRLGAFCLLLLGGGVARAEWTEVAADNGIYAAYADRATIRRHGPYARMLGMYDFPRGDFTPEGARMYSTVVEREYDCRVPQVRLVSYADHAERLGRGMVVGTGGSRPRWEAAVEGSVDLAYWKMACAGI